MKKIAIIFLFLLVAGCAGMSSNKTPINIDGTWRGEFERKQPAMMGMYGVQGGGGAMQPAQKIQMTFNFKREGDLLKGSISGAPGQWTPIEDGKIHGNKISFTVNSTFGQMKMTSDYQGKIKGEIIKMEFKNRNPGFGGRRGGGMGMSGGMGMGGGGMGGAGPSTMPNTQKITVERISAQPQGPVN